MSRFNLVLRHELLLSRRQGLGFGAAISFMLTVIVLAPLSLGPDLQTLSRLAPGLIWIALLLAVLLTAERIFHNDLEDGTMDIMVTGPLPLELVVLAKALAHWLTVGLPLALLAPPLALMFNINVSNLPLLWGSMICGSLALSLLATLGSGLTAGLRRGGLLLALLILPLNIPVLIFGVTSNLLAMGPQSVTPSLLILIGIDLICMAAVPFATAAALRAYLT